MGLFEKPVEDRAATAGGRCPAPRRMSGPVQQEGTMKALRMLLSVVVVACVVGSLLPGRAPAAEEPYPTRPIQIIVPFPPGGVADLVARPFATALEKHLKQPVVVVNKTGAGGAVGMQAAAVSKPDGYTLMVALSSISVMPEVDALFGRPPTS
jgi:tripartite-type tricarboxylate transporter receptor subunit TctC